MVNSAPAEVPSYSLRQLLFYVLKLGLLVFLLAPPSHFFRLTSAIPSPCCHSCSSLGVC